MTFEDTEKFIKENIDKFDAIIPDMKMPGQTLLDILDDFHSVNDGNELLPDNKRFDEINCLSDKLVNVLLTIGTTDKELEIILAATELFYNYSMLVSFNTKNLETLILLTKTKKTVEDSVKLLKLMYDRFRMFEACNVESETSTLSRKYYAELKAFMERKGDHDASYCTDRAGESECLSCSDVEVK